MIVRIYKGILQMLYRGALQGCGASSEPSKTLFKIVFDSEDLQRYLTDALRIEFENLLISSPLFFK